jgi:hypothetical protein
LTKPINPKRGGAVPLPYLKQNTMTDLIVEKVRNDLHTRSQAGIKKYGTTLAGNKGDHLYWLQHAYEEALDMALYLKRAIEEEREEKGEKVNEIKKELALMPYGNHNGLVIYCKTCGSEFEETAEGYYNPVKYESDLYDRCCRSCLSSLGKFS